MTLHFQVVEGWGIFYRGVDTAEYEDWKACGQLRPAAGAIEGKHLAVEPEHAKEWRRILPTEDDPGPIRVLRVSFRLNVANTLYFLGPRIDQIGPAYFAGLEALPLAIIEEFVP
jgi:hypothetical protein